eukprot:CAMPEP_0176484612 /NCGR_PEP_ID=MMETSP0200_2-20121128/4550_1 /TAXON_ID=947934 /ORGANISM="Chaetoceros sp., Strain GSL56" /LENGTH=346 /DNA_ID=CAMNT_0017881103 /DNA_START=118 /DNA_END=1158 /DNA_ORIENTATION=-
MSQDHFEALERTLQEINALSAIYSGDTSAALDNKDGYSTPPPSSLETACSTIGFTVLSIDEYMYAKSLLSMMDSSASRIIHEPSNLQDGQQAKIPTLVVQVVWKSQEAYGHSFHHHQQQIGIVHLELPQGYPAIESSSPTVSVISLTNWSRKQREELGNAMNEKAHELSGSDSLMELIHFFQDSMTSCCSSNMNMVVDGTSSRSRSSGMNYTHDESSGNIGLQITRCWIWVHHITNVGRCKDIVREAKERRLAGYLKHGYPGIVVIEGTTALCDDFVQWIKGSKSRPGGFGRNWGHHVRGQIVLDKGSKRSFSNEFQDIGEDLASLASICRKNGVEDEFLKYVMQH